MGNYQKTHSPERIRLSRIGRWGTTQKTTKRCIDCKLEKPLTEFYTKNKWNCELGTMKKYPRARCKPCLTISSYKHSVAYGKRYPEKTKARVLVSKMIRKGALVRGKCIVCGTNKCVEGHHPDYSKPLDVLWLCQRHHMEHHKMGLDLSIYLNKE